MIGSTGNFDQRESCRASNPPCEAIFSPGHYKMADRGHNTYELHKTHGALNLARQPDLVILSAAKDLFLFPRRICHCERSEAISGAEHEHHDPLLRGGRRSRGVIDCSACVILLGTGLPVPQPLKPRRLGQVSRLQSVS